MTAKAAGLNPEQPADLVGGACGLGKPSNSSVKMQGKGGYQPNCEMGEVEFNMPQFCSPFREQHLIENLSVEAANRQ